MTMMYNDGASCYQGPHRSARVQPSAARPHMLMWCCWQVHLRCGSENKLVHAHEPERCVYEGTFETPAVCSESHAEALKSEVEQEVRFGTSHCDIMPSP